ncbi:baseplate J/gp47 family protein [Candidatus Pacearchaeota archaeon]|nr:baseplate J/gp47 family protein [Candidatus Pacearchaeota archaeon]
MAGLTADGFLAKTEPELLKQFKDLLAADFGDSVKTDTDQAVMQLATPVIMELSELWEGYQLLYNFLNPNAAEGPSLDNIGTITNTPRVSGSKSVVTVNATGTEGSTISVGFIRSVQDTGAQFRTTELQTLPASGSQPLVFTMESIDDGGVAAPANTLNQGSLPSGVTDIINPTDAILGTSDETDEEYRIGRIERLSAFGSSTIPAIKAAILSVANVSSATVLENVDDVVDVNGIPPHNFRAIVTGSFASQDVIDAIGAKKPAGIRSDGTISGTFTDPTDGQTFTIRYSTATSILMYCDVVITSKTAEYPTNGDNLIEANLLALEWELGEDVILPKLQGAVTTIPGIVSYTLFFDTSASPLTDTAITINAGEDALFDSTRINITS